MTKHLKRLPIVGLLGVLIFAPHLLASKETPDINTSNATAITQVANNQTNNQALMKQGFVGNNVLVCEALKYLTYLELRTKADRISKYFKLRARDAQMPTGNAWIEWVKKLPPEKVLNEVKAACTRSPNPVTELGAIWKLYFRQIPCSEHFFMSVQQDDYSPSLEIPDETPDISKSQLRDELSQVSDEKQRQNLLTQLLPSVEKLRPYAVANILESLLGEDSDYLDPLDVPVTVQLAEQWLERKISPQMMQEYLRYVDAAHELKPIIHHCVAKQPIVSWYGWSVKKDIERAFAREHKLYAKIADQFKDLPLIPETFSAEDQLIALYKRYIGNLRQPTERRSLAGTLSDVDLQRCFLETGRGYFAFLDARHYVVIEAAWATTMPFRKTLLERAKKLKREITLYELGRVGAPEQTGNNNTAGSFQSFAKHFYR